jgi:hypothetical protein
MAAALLFACSMGWAPVQPALLSSKARLVLSSGVHMYDDRFRPPYDDPQRRSDRPLPPFSPRPFNRDKPLNNFQQVAVAFAGGFALALVLQFTTSVDQKSLANVQALDRQLTNPDVCLSYGSGAMVLDQRIYMSLNPLKVQRVGERAGKLAGGQVGAWVYTQTRQTDSQQERSGASRCARTRGRKRGRTLTRRREPRCRLPRARILPRGRRCTWLRRRSSPAAYSTWPTGACSRRRSSSQPLTSKTARWLSTHLRSQASAERLRERRFRPPFLPVHLSPWSPTRVPVPCVCV